MHAWRNQAWIVCWFVVWFVALFGLVYFGPFVFFSCFQGSIVDQQRRALNVWPKYLPIKLCLKHFEASLFCALHDFALKNIAWIFMFYNYYFLIIFKIISHQIWTQHHLSHERKRTNQQNTLENWKTIIITIIHTYKDQNNQTLKQKPSGWAMFVSFLH
jgi:hypothetical protein